MNQPCSATKCFFNTGDGDCWSGSMYNGTCPDKKLPEPTSLKVTGLVVNLPVLSQAYVDDLIALTHKVANLSVIPLKMISYKYAVRFHQDWIAVYKGPEKTHTLSNGRETTYRDVDIARCISHCVIHPMDTAKWYSGIAVLNPKEPNVVLAGYKQAFGKALDDHWNDLDTDLDLISFKKYFWEAFLKKNFTNENLPTDFTLRVKLPEGTIK